MIPEIARSRFFWTKCYFGLIDVYAIKENWRIYNVYSMFIYQLLDIKQAYFVFVSHINAPHLHQILSSIFSNFYNNAISSFSKLLQTPSENKINILFIY